MEIRQLRNATVIVTYGPHRLLVDPMLSAPGTMPGFKLFGGGRRRNPLVPLPPDAESALAQVTAVVVTHEHPDHVDREGIAWIARRRLPVWTNAVDAPSLTKKGLDVHVLEDGALGLRVETVRSRHGRGLLGWVMGPVAGYVLAHPEEPSLYLVGDSVLTPEVLEATDRLAPDVVVAPAGAANLGRGGDILFSLDELVTLVRRTRGQVVLNHLEALDHCPTTREALRRRMDEERLSARVHVPEDGETVTFGPSARLAAAMTPRPKIERPGFQKWVTEKLAGT